MANISFNGAVNAIVEALEWRKDDTISDIEGKDTDDLFNDFTDIARDALSSYIDNGLIYTCDILELWDGSTNENVYVGHENVYVGDGDVDLMRLVTQSTIYQLEEDWNGAIYDGIDRRLFDVTGKSDRAEALGKIVGA